ncbi:MAG: UpxY family transcription antiterminator [Bacteroidia bacterium]|jgi:transcription elongation factor/antiterminator RfaH|nr:UpxY family transcription antiterminator [Bacteroidia bacterium]
MTTSARWYALYTKPRSEKKVEAALAAKGITVYLPLQVTIKQWSDRKKKVQEPLFKSYLFVLIHLETSSTAVLQTPGVVKFVRIGSETIHIRESQIDAIKLLLSTETDLEIQTHSFQSGDKVLVNAGPLKGLEGYITNTKGNRNFAIAIEQLGSAMCLTVPASYLKAIS